MDTCSPPPHWHVWRLAATHTGAFMSRPYLILIYGKESRRAMGWPPPARPGVRARMLAWERLPAPSRAPGRGLKNPSLQETRAILYAAETERAALEELTAALEAAIALSGPARRAPESRD